MIFQQSEHSYRQGPQFFPHSKHQPRIASSIKLNPKGFEGGFKQRAKYSGWNKIICFGFSSGGAKVTDHKHDEVVVFGANFDEPWPRSAETLNPAQSETDTHGLCSQSANNCNNWIKHPIDLFSPPPAAGASRSSHGVCACSPVQTQVLNSGGGSVCFPAYIFIYLRALNWTSYSFGLSWSHDRVGSSVTQRHAGNTQKRAAHAASCLKCAAEKTARHK